jgi:hypothetical protein
MLRQARAVNRTIKWTVHHGIAQRVPDDECNAPRVTVTDIGTQLIRRSLS